jgi:hypothetical protein
VLHTRLIETRRALFIYSSLGNVAAETGYSDSMGQLGYTNSPHAERINNIPQTDQILRDSVISPVLYQNIYIIRYLRVAC